jgi:mRNA interferase RelE/StbE
LTWKIEWDDRARKELRKLDKTIQKKILRYCRTHIEECDNPKQYALPMSGNKRGFWRYRIGSYRLVCDIEGANFIVLVLRVGHRKEIYDN